MKNRRVVLRSRPSEAPGPDDFDVVECEVPEPGLLEAFQDNLKSRTFLGYEQDPTPLCRELGDHVGDCLALAGARWTVNNPILVSKSLADHKLLTRIGVKDQKLGLGWCSVDVAGIAGDPTLLHRRPDQHGLGRTHVAPG